MITDTVDHTHGFMDIEFDDYRIPANIWKGIARTKFCDHLPHMNECWIWAGPKDVNAKMVMVGRLFASRDDVLAVVPTCSQERCCRPSHLCVTRRAA